MLVDSCYSSLCCKCSVFCFFRKSQEMKQVQDSVRSPQKGARRWRKTFLLMCVSLAILESIWLFWHLNKHNILSRKEMLTNMCDERARLLQDQFNMSMNHVHALATLIYTFHHSKHLYAIDQKTFGEYIKITEFERSFISGVAYALKVIHSDREHFEKQHGWKIKKKEYENETLVQCFIPEYLDPAPIQDEYAPVIFAQETVSHIVSVDMMSRKEDHENILRARASGKGVLTYPSKLLKSNQLGGIVLSFAVYNTNLPPDATPKQHIDATVGFKQRPLFLWTAINASAKILVITLLFGHIFYAAISRITKVEDDYYEMRDLKARAKATNLAKSQFLATVSHEIKTPMNGVLGMLQILMDTELDEKSMDYAQTAHKSGQDLILVINKVLDQAKIEAKKLELETVAVAPHYNM